MHLGARAAVAVVESEPERRRHQRRGPSLPRTPSPARTGSAAAAASRSSVTPANPSAQVPASRSVFGPIVPDQDRRPTRLDGRWPDGRHARPPVSDRPTPRAGPAPARAARGSSGSRGPRRLPGSPARVRPPRRRRSAVRRTGCRPVASALASNGVSCSCGTTTVRTSRDAARPGRHRAQQGQGVRVVEGDPLAEAQRGERSLVHGARPLLQRGGTAVPQVGLHHRQRHPDTHALAHWKFGAPDGGNGETAGLPTSEK